MARQVAAARGAELWQAVHGVGKPAAEGRRHKADIQVVACALAARADAICRHHGDARRLAAGRIRVIEVPPMRPSGQQPPGVA